jgi:hypothetical protein
LQHESKAREKQQAKEEALIAQPADAIIKAGEDVKRRKGKGKEGKGKSEEPSEVEAATGEADASEG